MNERTINQSINNYVDVQVHFARCSEGKKQPVPCFGGSKGPELARNLREIEQTFDKYMMGLMAIRKTILDVKCSTWHDNCNKFRAGVKDLEVMVQNVINTGFRSITSVEEGVQLLEVFAHFTTREVCLYSCLDW